MVGTEVPRTNDYRELLERKDLDAIYVATPLAHHAEHVLAALKTDRPVYGEKAMGFTPEQCREIYAAATRPGALFQIGHQYRYAPWVRAAVEAVKKGKIGEPTHVYAYWHRNNDWRRPVPSPDPGGKLEHLINWRLYRETSGGLVTELGSHHIDIANWVFDATPDACYRHDEHRALPRWAHGGRQRAGGLQLSGRPAADVQLSDRQCEDGQRSVDLRHGGQRCDHDRRRDLLLRAEGASQAGGDRRARWRRHGITTGASYSTKGEMPYRGPGEKLAVPATEDPTLTACRAFIECVRAKRQPLANARVGYGSAIAAAIANRAVYEEQGIAVPALPA